LKLYHITKRGDIDVDYQAMAVETYFVF